MRLSKLLLAASCIAALSTHVSGQVAPSLERVEGHGTVGDMADELARKSHGLRPKVIGLDTSDNVFIFPAAGSVQGAEGTFFKSDVTIMNHRATDQRISVGWIAQGVNNSSRPLQHFNLTAGTPFALADFVTNALHESGLGAILVTGETSTDAVDQDATLDGFSRIYTRQPGSTGTVSLSFPAISILDSIGPVAAYALGMRQDAAYRCNVGIVNLDSAAHTWTVTIIHAGTPTSFSVTVDGTSMRQVPLPAGTYGDVLLTLTADASAILWSAYAASVDNVTGDGWVSHASHR